MDQSPNTQELVSPSVPYGAKILVGYFTLTSLAVIAIVIFINTRNNWASVLGGGFIIALWSVQVMITNVLILGLRYDRHFFTKAAAISIGSIFLIPTLGFAHEHIKWFLIGQPDVATFVKQASQSRCETIGSMRMRRPFGESTYDVKATIQCVGEDRPKECNWRIRYNDKDKQWKFYWEPVSIYCK